MAGRRKKIPGTTRKPGWLGSPKIKELRKRLGPGAILALENLWDEVAKANPGTGMVSAATRIGVAKSASLDEFSPGTDELRFVDTLLELELLDEREDGYYIHDWENEASHLVSQARTASEKSKKCSKAGSSRLKDRKPVQTQLPIPEVSETSLQASLETTPSKPKRTAITKPVELYSEPHQLRLYFERKCLDLCPDVVPMWGSRWAKECDKAISAKGLKECKRRVDNYAKAFLVGAFAAEVFTLQNFFGHFDRWAFSPNPKGSVKQSFSEELDAFDAAFTGSENGDGW